MPNTVGAHRDVPDTRPGRRWTRILPWLLILGLVAFEAANNWLWLETNVVIPGWDRPAHLGRSLAYYQTLTPISWQGLFKASVQDPIRPPLFFASATPLYWVFGPGTDVATMVNVVYWLVLLASVYGLGKHLGGWRLGLAGAVLAALLPLLYGISRSFYIEFSLAALVALTLYLLVASQGFERRGPSLLFGLVLGLGLLTKRTYPLFVAGPIVVVILRSRVLRSLWDRLRAGLQLSFTDLMIALGAGVGLAGLWVLPNRPQMEELGLGQWLFPAWAALVAVTLYLLLRRPRDAGVNCLAALGLGATVASLWWLPRLDVRRLLLYGYGIGDPRGRALDLGNIDTYTYYLRHTINEGVGLVFAALLILAVAGLVAWLLKTRARPVVPVVGSRKGSTEDPNRTNAPALPAALGTSDPQASATSSGGASVLAGKMAGVSPLSAVPVLPALGSRKGSEPNPSRAHARAPSKTRTATAWRRIWRADNGWWVLFLWPTAAYLLLTFSIYKEARAFVPALPGLAIILAAGFLYMPWRTLGRGLLGLAVVWGVVQFFVVSYAQFYEPARQTQFWSPVLGNAGLFARGVHLELPATGDTDPGYNIQPDVLSRAEARRSAADLPSVRLGVLAQTPQINAGSFLYSTLTRYPSIEVAELARNYEGDDLMPDLYGYEYLLVKRNNQEAAPLAQEAIDRILDDPPVLFQDAFVLETFYPLPDGDTAYLYRLRYWPDPGQSSAYVADAAHYLQGTTVPADALILISPELLDPLSRAGSGPAEIHLLLDAPAVPQALVQMSRDHRRLFVVLGDGAPADLAASVEEWLGRYAYRAEDRWFGGLRLALFGTTDLPPAEQATEMLGARFGDAVELTGTDLPVLHFQTGDVVPLTLFWQARRPVQADLKVFVHLLNAAGELVAQHDGQPAGGRRPTPTWQLEELIVDRHGVLLPPGTPPGEYQLVAGLYDASTGDRLPVRIGSSAGVDDHLTVGTIVVSP